VTVAIVGITLWCLVSIGLSAAMARWFRYLRDE
jgi:hypothetical protein